MDVPQLSTNPLSASRSLGSSTKPSKPKEGASKTDNLIASLAALNKAGVLSDQDFKAKKDEILSSKSKAKAKKVFDAFDTDKSGTIDRKELQVLVFQMGEIMTKAEVIALIKQLKNSQDGNAEITFDEFYAWWEGKSHATPTAQEAEKSRFLKMKLQSKSYSQTIKNQYQANQQLKGERTTTKPTEDGLIKLGIDLVVGEFKNATETVSLSADQNAVQFRDALGLNELGGAKVLIKLSPTATENQIQDVLEAAKTAIGFAQATFHFELKKKQKIKDHLQIRADVEEIKGEKYIAVTVNFLAAKPLMAFMSLHLEHHIQNIDLAIQYDRITLGSRVTLKLAISTKGIDTILNFLVAADSRKTKQYIKPLEAARLLKTFNFELRTKTWYEALQQLVGWETPNPGGYPDLSTESTSSSLSEDSSYGYGSSSSDSEQFDYINDVKNGDFSTYSSRGKIDRKIGNFMKKCLKRAADDAYFVAIGKTAFDSYLNTWSVEAYKAAYSTAVLQIKKSHEKEKIAAMFYPLTGGRNPVTFAHTLLSVISEADSVAACFGTLHARVKIDIPNLLDRAVAVKHIVNEDAVQDARRAFSLIRKQPGDHTVTVAGKQHKLHKALLAVRCPHLVSTAEFPISEQEFGSFLDYFYEDRIPEEFKSLLVATRAARKLAWKDFELAVSRAIFRTVTRENIWERLIATDGCEHDDLYIVNWYIHYAVTQQVPYYDRPPKKIRKEIKRGRLADPPSEDFIVAKLKDCHLYTRLEEQKQNLTLPPPVIPDPPRSNLIKALSVLASGQHADAKITVDSTEFHLHRFVMALRWPQFEQFSKNNSFVDVPADSFQKYVYYFYTGRSDGFTLYDYSYVCGHADLFPKHLVTHCSQRCLEITLPRKGALSSSSDAKAPDVDFEIIAASTGNHTLSACLAARENKKRRFHAERLAAFQANADSDRRRANHELFCKR